MSSPASPPRCVHNNHPKACLQCFHAPKPRAAAPPPRPVMGGQVPPVAPPHIQRAIDRQLKGVEGERVIVEVPKGEQEFNPVPRQSRPVQQAQSGVAQGGTPKPAWRAEEQQPWQTVEIKGVGEVQVPPRRSSLIDSQPQHPHLGQTTRH